MGKGMSGLWSGTKGSLGLATLLAPAALVAELSSKTVYITLPTGDPRNLVKGYIDSNNEARLMDGTRVSENSIVHTMNGSYAYKRNENNVLQGALLTIVKVTLPNGSTVNGYIGNGVTYMLGGGAPPVGSIVHTMNGSYEMKLKDGKLGGELLPTAKLKLPNGNTVTVYIGGSAAAGTSKAYMLGGGAPPDGSILTLNDGRTYKVENSKGVAVGSMSQSGDNQASLAKQILNNSKITLMSTHVSGNSDVNTALKNIQDTSNGLKAGISNYGNAPGGTTDIDARVLSGILAISDTYGDIRITAIAGSSHSTTSKHYSGLAVDIDSVGGTKINAANFTKEWYDAFESYAKNTLGASVVYHPYNDSGHTGSMHIQWK